MRLAQLARKLALRPVEIVNFLAQRSIVIDGGGNTRLEDSHVAIILEKFAPNGLPDLIEEEEEEKSEVAALIVPEEPVVEAATIEIVSTDEPEKVELIKAPKIELSGLKVLGKIELPEPKKKEATPVEPGTEDAPKVTRREVKPYQHRKDRPGQQQRPVKNPIAMQREREAREAEEKRKAAQERDKEKRTLHYLKKVNVVQPAKAVKVREEYVEEAPEIVPPAPKTLWGKFRRWLKS